MSLNRRQLFKYSAVLLSSHCLPVQAGTPTAKTLPIPPLVEVAKGRPILMSLQDVMWSSQSGITAVSYGFNGRYLGPTIRVKQHESLKISFTNYLHESAAVTFQGVLLQSPLLNNPLRLMQSKSSWSPLLPIRQNAATGWYTCNTDGLMTKQRYHGLIGLCQIEDTVPSAKLLPHRYGIDDIPVILQDKSEKGLNYYDSLPVSDEGFLGSVLVTNGVYEPVINVEKSWIRLRILNASNARRYALTLSNGQPFYFIASDLGLLNKPIELSELAIAPGERKEILIDMTQHDEVALITGDSKDFSTRLKELFEPSTRLSQTNVLTLKSMGTPPLIQSELPEQLILSEVDYSAVTSRKIHLSKEGSINGVSGKEPHIAFSAKLNTQEQWIVSVDAPQSLYIQGVEFLVVSRDGQAPRWDDSGYKDTVWIDKEVELLVRYVRPTGYDIPFSFSSQNTTYAQRGAIGYFIVNS